MFFVACLRNPFPLRQQFIEPFEMQFELIRDVADRCSLSDVHSFVLALKVLARAVTLLRSANWQCSAEHGGA